MKELSDELPGSAELRHLDKRDVMRLRGPHGTEFTLALLARPGLPLLGTIQVRVTPDSRISEWPVCEMLFRTSAAELEAFAGELATISRLPEGSARLAAEDFEVEIVVTRLSSGRIVVGGTANTPQIITEETSDGRFRPLAGSVISFSFDGIIADDSYLSLAVSRIHEHLLFSRG